MYRLNDDEQNFKDSLPDEDRDFEDSLPNDEEFEIKSGITNNGTHTTVDEDVTGVARETKALTPHTAYGKMFDYAHFSQSSKEESIINLLFEHDVQTRKDENDAGLTFSNNKSSTTLKFIPNMMKRTMEVFCVTQEKDHNGLTGNAVAHRLCYEPKYGLLLDKGYEANDTEKKMLEHLSTIAIPLLQDQAKEIQETLTYLKEQKPGLITAFKETFGFSKIPKEERMEKEEVLRAMSLVSTGDAKKLATTLNEVATQLAQQLAKTPERTH